jgi:glyoxylase-like metal-dependent hydrolase (beta-lactamase superfamily II)
MRLQRLPTTPGVYSGQVYYIRGDWNTLEDVNTLIDVGTDGAVVDELEAINHGVGKKKVEQVILTHEHFDHAAGLGRVIETYAPSTVIARAPLAGVTQQAEHGMAVRIGDREAQLLLTPGHSNDSISVYVPAERMLFVGDTNVNIRTRTGGYSQEFIDTIELYLSLDVEILFSGHDAPVTSGVRRMLEQTWANIRHH